MRCKRILVACEFSGTVRESFRKLGWDAWSCDLLPTEIEGNHFQCDVREILTNEEKYGTWDLMIAFPPCTDLATSGAKHFAEKIKDGRQERAVEFVRFLMNANVPKIAIENPVGVLSTKIRKPDQIIKPYFFGHPEPKQTCLWLKNLPHLYGTKKVQPGLYKITSGGSAIPEWYTLSASEKEKWKIRSKTFQGIADAMADQWGK